MKKAKILIIFKFNNLEIFLDFILKKKENKNKD